MRTLDIYFRDTYCARLKQCTNGTLQFKYLDSWLEHGRVPASLTLPLGQVIYSDKQYRTIRRQPFTRRR